MPRTHLTGKIVAAIWALFVIWAVCLWATKAKADYVVRSDGGGLVTAYDARWKAIARSGAHVVIDGPCYSACTFVLFDVPLDRVCSTPRGTFGFHAAFDIDTGAIARSFTRNVYRKYPASVSSVLLARPLTKKLYIVPGWQVVHPC